MFKLFGRKKEEKYVNPILETFNTFTVNQKMSVINLFLYAMSGDGLRDSDLKMQYIQSYVKLLGVNFEKCKQYSYLNIGSEVSNIITDLKPLSQSKKEVILMVYGDLININRRPTKEELDVFDALFKVLDVDEKKYIETYERTQELLKTLLR